MSTNNRFFAIRALALGLVLVLAAEGLAALAGSATRTRPSGNSSGSGEVSRAGAGSTRPGGSGSGTVSVPGRASFGRGGGYRFGGYYYHPYGWYGAVDPWYYGWYGWYGWPYGFRWHAPYGYGGYQPRPVAFSADPQAPAVLETDVYPRKARLILDGDDLGKVKYFNGNWDRLPLSAGSHELVFTAPGYRTLRIEMEVEAGRLYRLDYRMEKGEGEDPRSVKLPARPRENRPEASTEVRAAAAPARGLLRVRVTPGDAVVYLDGEFLGSGDELARLHGALAVAAGYHRLQVLRPGYVTRTLELEVPGSADPVRVELDLERE